MKPRCVMLVSLATAAALVASSLPPVRAQAPDEVSMSLAECLSRALENNLDLAIVKRDPAIALNNVTFEKAAFDPVLGANAQYRATRNTTNSTTTVTNPPGAPQLSNTSDRAVQERLSADITQKLNFGATYAVRAFGLALPESGGRFEPTFPILFSFDTNRPYTWGYGLNFKLPLLQGFGRAVNEAAILVAKHNVNISHDALRNRAETTVQNTENAYWDLLAARKAQEVAEQALKLSQDLYDLNKKKVEVGTLAPIEITQAEANVASNVEGTIRTKQAVKNAEDALRSLLAVPANDPLWTKTIVPTEEPKSDPTVTDQDAAIQTAYEHRPEVRSAHESIDIAKVNEAAAKNLVKHSLNLEADWARTHAESVTAYAYTFPVQPPYTVDGVTHTQPDWYVQLTYAYPFGNRAAKSSYANAKLGTEKSEITLESTLQDVRVDVRKSARAVESGYERVVAARKNVELQQKKLDAEQKKFDNGMSTSFEVFTFQTDLRNAQLSLIQAMLDYNKALADLERSKGTLLDAKGLKLDEGAGR